MKWTEGTSAPTPQQAPNSQAALPQSQPCSADAPSSLATGSGAIVLAWLVPWQGGTSAVATASSVACRSTAIANAAATGLNASASTSSNRQVRENAAFIVR